MQDMRGPPVVYVHRRMTFRIWDSRQSCAVIDNVSEG